MTSFRIVGREELVRSWSWQLERVTVEHETSTFTREVVRHPGAVTVVAVDGGEVLLVRQYRASVDSWVLEACAGTRDVLGEPAVECAARELLEEVGVVADTWTSLGEILVTPGLSDERNSLFLAEGLHDGEVQRHGPEEDAMSVERRTFAEIGELLRSGQIDDAKTVIALSRSAQVLRMRGIDVPVWC